LVPPLVPAVPFDSPPGLALPSGADGQPVMAIARIESSPKPIERFMFFIPGGGMPSVWAYSCKIGGIGLVARRNGDHGLFDAGQLLSAWRFLVGLAAEVAAKLNLGRVLTSLTQNLPGQVERMFSDS